VPAPSSRESSVQVWRHLCLIA